MPAPPVFTQEFFRPLANKWLAQISLGDIDPEAIVKGVVDDGRVATSFPSPLPANSIFVFKKGCISGDPGTFPFSESLLMLTLFTLPHGFGGITTKVKNKYPCTVHCRYGQGRLGTSAVCL